MKNGFESIGWQGDTITKGLGKEGEARTLEKYESELGFNRTELEGKCVLDLGSGLSNKLDTDIQAVGIHATVISLSPDLKDSKYREVIDEKRLSVAGLGEQLPFRDECFDEILSMYSLAYYSEANYKIWIPECLRVLKKNGILRVGGFQGVKIDMYDSTDKFWHIKLRGELVDYIQGLGCQDFKLPDRSEGGYFMIRK